MQMNKVDSYFSFCESLINGCHIVSYGFDKDYVDEKGIVQKKKVTKFNVMKPTGTLVYDNWFDVYKVNDEGEVIFCVLKSVTDYERTLSLYNLEEIGSKLVPTEHGKMLIEGTSLEDTVDSSYKYSYGFINKTAMVVINPVHDIIEFGTEDTCIVGRIDYNIKYGLIDTIDGHQITPISFSKVNNFSCGLARVKGLGKYRFVARDKVITDVEDKTQYAFSNEFDCVSDFVDGSAQVRFGATSYSIGVDGEMIPSTYVRRKSLF